MLESSMQLEDCFNSQELMFIGQVSYDIETCLKEKLKYLSSSREINMASYALAILSLDYCQQALGVETTYKILKKYQDELEAHLKDQQVKGTPFSQYA